MTSLPRPRKKRFPEAELLARIKRYEAALKSYGADIDSINNSHLHKSNAGPGDSNLETGSLSSTPTSFSPKVDTKAEGEPLPYRSAHEDVMDAERLLQGSSDDEVGERPVSSAYDEMYQDDNSGLIFGMLGFQGTVDLGAIHPPPMQMFGLWQVFLDNIHPLTKIVHAPTIQQQLLKLGSNMENAPIAMHILMFAIYSAALNTLEVEDCLSKFGEDKETLSSRYHTGFQYALSKSNFLRSQDLTVLQAFIIFVMSVRRLIDPRSLFCITGLTDRIARKNGLHRDIQYPGMTFFESEMRRRLWWQIVLFESRVAEMSAAGTSILSTQSDAKLPLNLNDADINREMKNPPQEHIGATEMIFALVRAETAEFLRQIRANSWLDMGYAEFRNHLIPLKDKLKTIDDFEKHLEDKYFKYCDPQIAVHVMAKVATQQALGKMRLQAYDSPFSDSKAVTRSPKDEDDLLVLSIEQIERHNDAKSSPLLEHFHWYLNAHFPFPATVQVLSRLRSLTTGPLADRGWTAVTFTTDVFRGPGRIPGKVSAISFAIGNLLVKAWEAREAALRDTVRLEVPPIVGKMRDKLAIGRSSKSASSGSTGDLTFEFENVVPQPESIQLTRLDASQPPLTSGISEVQVGQDTVPSSASRQVHSEDPMILDLWNSLMPDSNLYMDADWTQFSMYK